MSRQTLKQDSSTGDLRQSTISKKSVAQDTLQDTQSNAGTLLEGHRSLHHKKKRLKRKKSARHRHHHRQKEVLAAKFDQCEGVVHVILTEEIQRLLKCVVGENVTAEKPWTHVNKFYISEQVESEDVPPQFLTFLPFRQQISDYPNDTLLIGYIPDESREYDEFYLCITLEAVEEVMKLVKEQEEKQQARLENTINKTVGQWTTLGSEVEIEENWITPNRGLYVIEFEAKYPIISADVKFRFRLVHQARDGYAELLVGPRYTTPILHKRRIHNNCQVAPIYKDNDAQTYCSYPTNAWTQYEYYVDFIDNLSREWMANFRGFIEGNYDDLSDVFRVNGDINFYTNDYMDLVNKEVPVMGDSVSQEYQSFDDVKRCMNKMISAMSWHPMWTGVIAIAYADISPRWYNVDTSNLETNFTEQIVHGYNPVLIWSFDDSLYPKLILETNAEIHCLSFCPHDPNLLVGGCVNGQVILWDIKNKLAKVEAEEILTPAQQSYRTRLFADMAWMKNTRDYSIVPPTAFSQLLFSHVNNVTAIEWVHPMYKVEKTGHLNPINEDESVSLQFVTSSSDGTIKFWDLRQKAIITGDYRPERKSRRLGKRPSALTMDVSTYRILNRRMLPHYELNITLPGSEKLCPVASISIPADKPKYLEVNPDPNKKHTITDRVIYTPVNEYPQNPILPYITIGTYTGQSSIVTWQGYEYISGDIYSKEDAKYLSYAKYHDGPVLTCKRHPQMGDVCLTIGGKIFCIWVEKLTGKPLIWRRSRNKYTHGNWETGRPSCFCLTTSDGSREYWNLDSKSDGPYSQNMYSGKPLLESEVHPLPIIDEDQRVVGIADDRGTLRLICYNTHKGDEGELYSFEKFLKNNADRALDFEEWQANWTNKHTGWIKQQAQEELAEQARLREEEQHRQANLEEQQAKEAIEEAKRAAAKLHAPPGKYEEWAMERWIIKEQERMGNELLINKRLDKETLVKQQAPLKKLEIEAARKQQKIKARLAKVDEIFDSTIAMLFPNLVVKPLQEVYTKVTYSEEQTASMEANFISAFYDVTDAATEIIESNPFTYELDFKRTLATTKNKKLKDEFKYMDRHSDRYKRYIMQREASAASFQARQERIKEVEEEEAEDGEGEGEEKEDSLSDDIMQLF